MKSTKLDWENIPDSNFNVDALPAKPFRFQQSILPKPVIVKAGYPKMLPGAGAGILQFAVEEGLPGLSITASVIDQYGNTWLATEKGLCRYTGDYLYIYSFLNKSPQGNPYTILQMTADKEGNVWITTGGDGIYCLNVSSNILKHNPLQAYSSGLLCDHTGNIWLATYVDGLFIIDTKNETIKNTGKINTADVTNFLTGITEDHNNNIWLGYYDHINILDASRRTIKNITKKEGLKGGSVLKFLEDRNGDMWIGTVTPGVNFISLKNKTLGTLDNINGFNGAAVEMVEDSRQQLWIFRRDTSYVLNKERTSIRRVLLDIQMLSQNFKGSSHSDNNGNIWVGTLDKGAMIIDPGGPLPEHLTTANGLIDNNVWKIMEDKNGKIWMGTHHGINIYDPVSGQTKVITKSNGLFNDRIASIAGDTSGNMIICTNSGFAVIDRAKKILINYNKSQYIREGVVEPIIGKDGRLWLSSYNNGIIQYDIHNNSAKIIDRAAGLLSNIVWDMVEDSHGNIWAASDSGISIINPASNTIKFLRQKQGLCHNIVYKLLPRPNDEMWAGTVKGISVINTEKFTITNLTAKEGLYPEEIYDLVEQNGNIYAGTSDGLTAVKKPAGNDQPWRFLNYGKREGFPFNDYNQNAATATSNGQTWWGITPVLTVVTQQPLTDTLQPRLNITGISIMDQAVSFNTYTGLGKLLKTGDTIWNENKTTFYIKNTLPKDSGYAQNNSISWDSTMGGFNIPAGLTLPYNQNSVNFSFSNTDVKGREKILYRYILEGAEKEWNELSDKSITKNYFNLAEGHYTFKVSTRGFNGKWSAVETCSFTILPPWWKTWWAYLLYVAVAVFVTSAYARYRAGKLIKENQLLENRISQRTAELSKSLEDLKATQHQLVQSEKMASLGELTAGIAHEIQNPLNFVNNFSEVSNELIEELKDEKQKPAGERDTQLEDDILDDIASNLQKINHHGKRADAIIKGMLQHSRTSSGQKELTSINELCDEYLRLAYHGLRAKDKSFNAKFQTDLDGSIEKINVVPQDIGRVFLNLVNNAFYAVNERKKQNEPGYEPTVTVSTKKLNNAIEIKVKDNGGGIPQKVLEKIFQPFFTTKPTGQGTGLGLSLSYDIVKAHGGEIKVETKENEGTAFIILLPLRDTH
ncbi:MAG: two-component regulator propeller domain-containing protein [Ferruginibacter sp.]